MIINNSIISFSFTANELMGYNILMKDLALYIHIPFCEKKCDYCSFVSFCMPDNKKIEYINSLILEIRMQGRVYKDYNISTIYIGGGTPSCLPTNCIYLVLQSIFQSFKVKKDAEISIEGNPNSLTIQKLREYKRAGVNRLSIGLQSYSNRLLKLIGRIHNKKQFDEALKNAKLIGFKNISVDIILGLPNQRLSQVKKELKHLVKNDVTHISAYGLMVEEGTRISQNLKDGVYRLPSEEKQVKMYDFTKKYLTHHGLKRYEVSNFAKEGYICKHNYKYWSNAEYLGLGVVSSSFINEKRWKNIDNITEYINKIKHGVIPTEQIEIEDKSAQIEETVMLQLRTQKGIDLNDFYSRFSIDLLKDKKEQIDELISSDLLAYEDRHLYCTDKGFKVLNQIILCLID